MPCSQHNSVWTEGNPSDGNERSHVLVSSAPSQLARKYGRYHNWPKMMLARLSFRGRQKCRVVFAQRSRKSLMLGCCQGQRQRLRRVAQFMCAPLQPVLFFGDGFVAAVSESSRPSLSKSGQRR